MVKANNESLDNKKVVHVSWKNKRTLLEEVKNGKFITPEGKVFFIKDGKIQRKMERVLTDKADIQRKALLEMLRKGVTMVKACKASGVGHSTVYEWMRDDKKFAEAVEDAKLSRVQIVEDALFNNCQKGNERAQEFFLTNRRNGNKDKNGWMNTFQLQHTGKGGVPLVPIFGSSEKDL